HVCPWVDVRQGSTVVARPSLTYDALGQSAGRFIRAVQIPSGKSFDNVRVVARFHGSSSGAAPANGDVYTDAWMVAVGDTEGEARSRVATYFDGDTEGGATDNESHYRWTGEPHASPSEKYLPALNIGDSDNWNVIEQYRHDGTGWVRVELSHYVFSTVDLGKATVGELDGIRIMGKTVRGEQLSGDAIDGKVITAPTIQSARSGRRWVGDPNGIRIINEDDDVRRSEEH